MTDCEICGKERWVDLRRNGHLAITLLKGGLCKSCAQKERNYYKPRVKRLRINDSLGYVHILIGEDDFFYPMARKSGRVPEHRLVMAKSLNRCLLPWEIVHHRNGIKDDNRLENLALINGDGSHNTLLNKAINTLQRENAELKERLSHYENQGAE